VGGVMIENQQIFNIIIVIAGFLAAFVVNKVTKDITRMEEDLKEFSRTYIAKDDYRADIADIKNMLSKIFDRLDQKVDK
jgi:flagellar motor component MotA